MMQINDCIAICEDTGMLRVGSWPGRSYRHNAFIGIFCDALEAAGGRVVDVADPRKVSADAIDILIIHWPEQIFWRGMGPTRTAALTLVTLGAIQRLRWHGVTVVWLVHNLKPHKTNRYQRALWWLIVRCLRDSIDGFITLSPGTIAPVAEQIGFHADVPRLAVRHPAYPVAASASTKEDARRKLGIADSGLVLAFVGQIIAYKGIAALARTFIGVRREARLVIAGGCHDSALAQSLVETAMAASGRIDLRIGRLSDAEFEATVYAADYVVLPFEDYLHSGSVIHALSLGRPVLTPATPFASDLVQALGSQWVHTFTGVLTSKMIDALPTLGDTVPNLEPLSPDRLRQSLATFLHKLPRRARW